VENWAAASPDGKIKEGGEKNTINPPHAKRGGRRSKSWYSIGSGGQGGKRVGDGCGECLTETKSLRTISTTKKLRELKVEGGETGVRVWFQKPKKQKRNTTNQNRTIPEKKEKGKRKERVSDSKPTARHRGKGGRGGGIRTM